MLRLRPYAFVLEEQHLGTETRTELQRIPADPFQIL